MRETLERLQPILQYEFDDISFLETAITQRSVSSRNNERSEFLGDSFLGFVIADYLFMNFPSADEGQLSRLRASLVKKETLAKLAHELGLGKFLKLGQGELKSGGHNRDSILADAVEAIIAAIYLDGGYQKARQFLLNLYQEQLNNLTLIRGLKDPKTRLQELLQSRKIDLPQYELINSTVPQHNQQSTVDCRVPSINLKSVGKGVSKRKAEQDAAEQLLGQLEDV